MDINAVSGSTLHRLIQSVMPQSLPTAEPTLMQSDVVDIGRAPGAASGAVNMVPFQAAGTATMAPVQPAAVTPFPQPVAHLPGQTPAASAAPIGFPGPAVRAPGAETPTGSNNNPTVLTMNDPSAQSPLIDVTKSPVEQARDLNAVLLQKITEVGQRSGMLTSNEVQNHLGLLAWSADHLENLSQMLEAEGKAQSPDNQFIEGLQGDLGAAVQSFQDMHRGSLMTEMGATVYKAQVEAEVNNNMFQFNVMNGQRRSGVINYYTTMRSGFNGMGGYGGGYGMGMPMPMMGPNMPLGPNGLPIGAGLPIGPNGLPAYGYPGSGLLSTSGVNLGPGGYGPYGAGYSGVNMGAVSTYPNTAYR